ncbi:MAG: HflK protein [Rhodanobacter sp. 68-29]|uniref:FtsH protease activity modulator HflK n=1 Tax=Rhodanobacter sp. PCA2 TaxID=2006117 RepID=UPI00086B7B0F|nr:FtsH protease activity modulator HflK [Rhodanobacter sp. PCA2]MBA2078106.1 FtsH protease activity modulator HflK [Rhodanobacter sp. PCA2]MBN8923175.1 FtsH protease activity modulator HflK [Rhodanobacter sp.]ODU73723.1 MAG: HflK protein [Rhodanobacter sp. SCN 69-32]OJY59457.1 MAG: HflK protein [Rhodanobacter sp. 68-29]
MAWNEPGGGQRDPWNRQRPNSGGFSPEQWLKDFGKHFGRLGRGPGGILTAIVVLVVMFLLMSSYTIIGARQVGVVLRFGEYARSLPPGFHLKLPNPIESVDKVEATGIRSVNDRVSMLTRDENIIAIDFTVQYQVDDAYKYLFSVSDPDASVGAAAEAAVRSVIGSSDMDQVLSADGSTLVTQAQQALQKTLDSYNSGLRVTEVSFQNVAPPAEVKDAFDDVNNAREDKQSIENNALAYANKVVPVARGDAARIAAEAEGYKAERIARAQGDVARFDLLLKEYKAAPAVTRKRLWLETMEQVMADNPKVIDGSGGRNIINLPAAQRTRGAADATGNAAASVIAPASASSSGDADKEKQP